MLSLWNYIPIAWSFSSYFSLIIRDVDMVMDAPWAFLSMEEWEVAINLQMITPKKLVSYFAFFCWSPRPQIAVKYMHDSLFIFFVILYMILLECVSKLDKIR